MKNIYFILLLIYLFQWDGLNAQKKEPVDYVDPLMGTHDSRWMQFPGPTMPFGMVKLSPDNERSGWKAGY